jgi:hypothetical protein
MRQAEQSTPMDRVAHHSAISSIESKVAKRSLLRNPLHPAARFSRNSLAGPRATSSYHTNRRSFCSMTASRAC